MSPKKIALLGIVLAIMIVLSTLESFLSVSFFFLPPHFKPGLANIIVMFCAFYIGRSHAVFLNVFKSLFIFIIRGPMAGLLSLSGGLLSIVIIIILVSTFSENRISYSSISVIGAVAHNIGQYAVVIPIMSLAMPYLLYYFPALIISGVVMGMLTGVVLKILIPALLDKAQYFK